MGIPETCYGSAVKLCVIGTGYVGLVTGTCFAATGQRVVCVDTDASKIERLQRHQIPIYEPGLEEMVRENASAGRLTFSTDLAAAVRDVDLAFIAVGWNRRDAEESFEYGLSCLLAGIEAQQGWLPRRTGVPATATV